MKQQQQTRSNDLTNNVLPTEKALKIYKLSGELLTSLQGGDSTSNFEQTVVARNSSEAVRLVEIKYRGFQVMMHTCSMDTRVDLIKSGNYGIYGEDRKEE